jgi:hypothetical protein
MTSKKNRERLKQYRLELDHSRQWREQNYDKSWELFSDLYRHRAPGHDADVDGGDVFQVNIVHANINIIEASNALYSPRIMIDPRGPDDFARAVITEEVINYKWRKHGYQDQVRASFKDSRIFGHGWLKTIWDFKSEEVEKSDQELQVEFDELRLAADALAVNDPGLGANLPTDDEIREGLEKLGTVITRDEAKVDRVSPFDMYVDPDGTDMTNIRWVAQRIKIPLLQAEANKRFDKEARESLSADTEHRRIGATDLSPDGVHKPVEYAVYYEFYDLEDGALSFFGESGENFLIDPVSMPYTFGHPFEFIPAHTVPDRFYPMGDVETIADLQIELNETRSSLLNDRKRYRRQFLYRPETLSDEAIAMLRSNEDNVMAPIEGDAPFDDVMAPVPQLALNPDAYDVSAMIQGDMDLVSAVTDYQRGGSPASRTATEAAILNDASQSRAAETQSILEQAMGNVARKIVMLMQQYMETADIIRITGVTEAINEELAQRRGVRQIGDQVFFGFDRNDISGEFDFTVEAGSSQPQNESVRRQEALQLMNVMVPFLSIPGPTGQPLVDASKLVKHILSKGFGIKQPEKFLATMPPPGQQEDPLAALMGGQPGQQNVAEGGPPVPGTPVGGAPPVGAIPVAGEDGQNPVPQSPGSLPQLRNQVGLNL